LTTSSISSFEGHSLTTVLSPLDSGITAVISGSLSTVMVTTALAVDVEEPSSMM
jgi:hypothetical protein